MCGYTTKDLFWLWFPNWCLLEKPLPTYWFVLFWIQIHIFRAKVVLAWLLTTGAAPGWTNELSRPAFWPFLVFPPQWTWKTKTWTTSWTTTGSVLYPCRPSPKLRWEVPKKKRREKKKKFNPDGKNCQSCQWALWEPVHCPPKASGGWSRHKKWVPWLHVMPGPDCK